MASFFDRFTKLWGINGGLEIPSDTNANAGMEFLGDDKPSKQFFNWLFQTVDQKTNWLWRQLNGAATANNLTLSATDDTTLTTLLAQRQPQLGFIPVQQSGGFNQIATKTMLGQDSTYVGLRYSYQKGGTTTGGGYLISSYGTEGGIPSRSIIGDLSIDANSRLVYTDVKLNGTYTTGALLRDVTNETTRATGAEATIQADVNTRVSGTYSMGSGDKRGLGLHYNSVSGKMWAGYDGGGTDLAWSSDVTTEASTRSAADANLQTQVNDKMSGTYGWGGASSSDKRGIGAHLNGTSGRANFWYDGGSGDLAWAVDVSNESTARANADANLQAGVNDKVSGTVSMASSDSKGLGLHLNGTSKRAWFGYDNGSGGITGNDLAWYSDVSAEATARANADNVLLGKINTAVSGTLGLGSNDQVGAALHYNGTTGKMVAGYGTTVSYRDLAWAADVTAEALTRTTADADLQTQVNDKVSGTYGWAGASSTDKRAYGIHYNGGSGKINAWYDDGSANGAGGDLAWANDVANEASRAQAAENALSSAKVNKSGDSMSGSLILTGGSSVVGPNGTRLTFETGGHVSLWDNNNTLIWWWSVSDGATQSVNSSYPLKVNATISATQLNLPNDSQSPIGNIDIYAKTPFINFHYNNASSYTTQISNDAAGQLTLFASSGVRFSGGRISGTSGSLSVFYGSNNDYSMAYQNDGNAVFYSGSTAFASFKDTGSTIRSPLALSGGFSVTAGSVTFQSGAIAQDAVNGLVSTLGDKMSGSYGMGSSDKRGLGIHYNGGSGRANFWYDGNGNGDLAWFGDVSYETNRAVAAEQGLSNNKMDKGGGTFTGAVNFNVLSTCGTAPAGSRNGYLANTAFVCGTTNAGQNGYMVLPSGMIEQWGIYTTNSDGTIVVNFPMTFPNVCLNVQVCETKAGGSWFNNQPTWHGVYDTPQTGSFEAVTRGFSGGSSGQAVVATGIYRAIGW